MQISRFLHHCRPVLRPRMWLRLEPNPPEPRLVVATERLQPFSDALLPLLLREIKKRVSCCQKKRRDIGKKAATPYRLPGVRDGLLQEQEDSLVAEDPPPFHQFQDVASEIEVEGGAGVAQQAARDLDVRRATQPLRKRWKRKKESIE